MPSIYNQVLFHWIDVNGRPATTFWTTQDQDSGGASSYAALAEAAQALSVAGLNAIQFQATLQLGATPTTGAYQSVTDRAVFLSKIAGYNQTAVFAIPAPAESIFLAGNELVDMTNASVIALSDAIEAYVGDSLGHPNGPLVRGNRQRARGG